MYIKQIAVNQSPLTFKEPEDEYEQQLLRENPSAYYYMLYVDHLEKQRTNSEINKRLQENGLLFYKKIGSMLSGKPEEQMRFALDPDAYIYELQEQAEKAPL